MPALYNAMVPLVMVGVAAAGGCAHKAPEACEKPESLRVVIKTGKNLNPGEDGQALPTIVRVYVMRSDQMLMAATADDVQRSDQEAIGSDVVESRELTVKPASYEKVVLERRPGANFVAVAGFVRDPQGNAWRAIKRVPAENPQHCHHGKPGDTGPAFEFLIDSNRVEAR